MFQNAWCRIEVTAVTPGAVYESQLFDQYVGASSAGISLELFDMAPMIGVDLASGDKIEALISVDPYSGLSIRGTGGTEGTTIVSTHFNIERQTGAFMRPDILERPWSLVNYFGRVPVLLPRDRVESFQSGDRVEWTDAVFSLLGWRRLPSSA